MLLIIRMTEPPTSEEVIAATSSWFFWDPQAMFAALRDKLTCPKCNKPGLSQDGWSKLPRKVHDISGLVLLQSRCLACKGCASRFPKIHSDQLIQQNFWICFSH